MRRIITILFASLLLLTTACVDETEYADNPRGNFEALWRAIDEHYCFFDYKHEQYGLDWDEVHERYSRQIADDMTTGQLFEVLGNMLGELRDSLDARGLTFDWDGSLVDYLVKKSYSVQYGARNLRRTIQKDLEDPIAEKLIDAYQNPLHALHAKADGEHVTLESE